MKLNTTKRKRFRVSNKVKRVSSKDRYRLCLLRSSRNIFAQIIDDSKSITLVSASSIEKDIKTGSKVNKSELSKIVAEKLARKAQEKKIKKIYFDLEKIVGETDFIIKNVKVNDIESKNSEEFFLVKNIQNLRSHIRKVID